MRWPACHARPVLWPLLTPVRVVGEAPSSLLSSCSNRGCGGSLRTELSPPPCEADQRTTELKYKFQSFQELCEAVISSERLKKRLDCQQIDDIRFVIDRFVEALECQIEIF